jgi:hypothetical protein
MQEGNVTTGSYTGLPPKRLYEVKIAAYVRLSFGEELELSGSIGGGSFTAESSSHFRSLTVASALSGNASTLQMGLFRIRGYPITGEVMGQPISGQAIKRPEIVVFQGMAGQEPLQYQLTAQGPVTSFDRDLGLRIVFQSFFSEILGSVDRVPDALMVAMLLPLMHYKHDASANT